MDEFALIRRYFSRPNLHPNPHTVLGVGDDAAIIAPTPGMQLAVSADTFIEGRHFFVGTDAYAIGWKALAVNLSDMAAMGATPRWFTLCLTLPPQLLAAQSDWCQRFADGLYALAAQHNVALIGGDTTAGHLSISIQIIGEVAPGQALRRSGAQAGDEIWLSGITGLAALAVQQRLGKLVLNAEGAALCAKRLDFPEPRVALGKALCGVATAAIDVSDGLIADLGHIATQSNLLATLQFALLEAAAPAYCLFDDFSSGSLRAAWCEAALSGGDDYELCFTAPAAAHTAILAIGEQLNLPVCCVGSMVAPLDKVSVQHVRVVDAEGKEIKPRSAGFNHFAG